MTDEVPEDTPTSPATPQAMSGEAFLPDELTAVTPAAFYAALRAAWERLPLLAGSTPSRASLLVLVGHFAFETGWGHACHRFNLGNVKHRPGDGRCWTAFRCNEVIAGKLVWFDPPVPPRPDHPTAFRAFRCLEDGCVDYLTILRGQFGFAWPQVEAGDAAAFCHALKTRGYFTADETVYTRGVVACVAAADHVIPSDPEPVADMHPLFVPPDARDTDPAPPEDS